MSNCPCSSDRRGLEKRGELSILLLKKIIIIFLIKYEQDLHEKQKSNVFLDEELRLGTVV